MFACNEKSLACQTPTAQDTAQLGYCIMVSAIVICPSTREKDSLVSHRMGVSIVMLNHSLQCPCQLENVYRNLLARVQALQLRLSLTQIEAREGAVSRWLRTVSTHQALTRRPSRDIAAILAKTGAVRADRAVDCYAVRGHTSKVGLDHHRG